MCAHGPTEMLDKYLSMTTLEPRIPPEPAVVAPPVIAVEAVVVAHLRGLRPSL
jgi:hypothetical protein